MMTKSRTNTAKSKALGFQINTIITISERRLFCRSIL